MVVAGTDAPVPLWSPGWMQAHRAAPLRCWHPELLRDGEAHRVLCVIQWGSCLSASARGELRDNAFSAVPVVALS